MGNVIECKSNSKIRKIEEEMLEENSICDIEKKVLNEYNYLKLIVDEKSKGPHVDYFFKMDNYDKKLSRLLKWIKIGFKEISEDELKQYNAKKQEFIHKNEGIHSISLSHNCKYDSKSKDSSNIKSDNTINFSENIFNIQKSNLKANDINITKIKE